jgi:hypothetical protein
MWHFFYIVYLMSDRDYLGEFEHIVVLALLRLADQAYGVTVRQEIEVRISREVSIGAVYATLARLETKGYVNSYLGDLYMANCYGDLKRSDLRNTPQLSRSCGSPCETPRQLLYRLAPGVSDECQK